MHVDKLRTHWVFDKDVVGKDFGETVDVLDVFGEDHLENGGSQAEVGEELDAFRTDTVHGWLPLCIEIGHHSADFVCKQRNR